jgi:hypothetical protein
MRIPEPLVDPVWASSSFMKTPSACSSSGAHQPVPTSGSVGTTPASTKTTGTKNARWRVLVTMVANALSLESTRFHSSAGTAPSKQHGTGTRSLAGEPRTSPGRCGAVLPSKRGESRTFERDDELSGRRGILVRLPRRPRRRGHCCQRCTTATHIVPASLRTSGPRSMRRPHAGECLTRDHPEERTLLAWNSDDCDPVPPAAASHNGQPSPNFRHHNRLSERGTTRRHPSRDRPVSNDAFALEPPQWNHAFEKRPLPATRSHFCAPEQRLGISRPRARAAGRRWLASPRSRKSLGPAAPVWTSKTQL